MSDGRKLDISGHRFGRLVAVEIDHVADGSKTYWRCLCDCGAETVSLVANLRRGTTRSCGCLARESFARAKEASQIANTRHGKARTRTYKTWVNMLDRCRNPRSAQWGRYGGRGITVCERWYDFANFYVDMGDKPPGLSLERKDNDGPYSPRNCRWATAKEQANNKGCCVHVMYQGQRLTLQQASDLSGLHRCTIRDRIKRGWPEHLWYVPAWGRSSQKS